jgi:hypothetical protein
MTDIPAIEIGELLIPGVSKADAALIAEAAQGELERLFLADREAGVDWRRRIGSITLDADPALSGRKLGQSIARSIRAKAIEPERAR